MENGAAPALVAACAQCAARRRTEGIIYMKRKTIRFLGLQAAAAAAILAGCASDALKEPAVALPAGDVALDIQAWPKAAVPRRGESHSAIEQMVEAILARMTLEEKVGQILQPEITNVSPDEVREYNIGSVLNGGNGRPNRDPYATPAEWLALADAYYNASIDTSDGGVGVPIIWGIDSVHGNNSIYGGTIFPHNIGLGAANDPSLMREIGRVTAVESAAIGTDWTFAPAVSVARDDRWGRTYESFSEDPEIVSRLTAPFVEGLQGAPGDDEKFFAPGSIIATIKHYIADGGTANGRDQGDAQASESDLRQIHMPPYVAGLEAGAQTVMASYSKWNGVRMHGHGPLLTTLLKDHMGFDGFVIGDFNGHALIPGCTNADCPEALNAGVDMYMIPADWRQLYTNLVAQAKSGEIPMARLDDAVRRVLRVKARAGLFDAGKPSARPFAGAAHIGTDVHRDVARRAARQSMTLLKNNGAVLPLSPRSRVLVAGAGADRVPMLVGGWSLNWQGSGLSNKDFPTGASVYKALSETLSARGGRALLSPTGEYARKPDAAIVVFGEAPYAEYQGDRESVLYSLADYDRDLKVMQNLQAAGVPVIGVFVSGRPLWINPHINASDAMIAAFLPGTEGGRAIADLIVQDRAAPRYDFTGRLSFSWPKTAAQSALNKGDANYDPLFALGYGLSLKDATELGPLAEDPGLSASLLAAAENSVFFEGGRALAPWRIYLGDDAEARLKTEGDRFVASTGGAIKFESADRNRQEDTKIAEWSGKGRGRLFFLGYSSVDFSRRAKAGEAIVIEANVTTAPASAVSVGLGASKKVATTDATSLFKDRASAGWGKVSIPLSCFSGDIDFVSVDLPLAIETSGEFALQIADVRLGAPTGDVLRCE